VAVVKRDELLAFQERVIHALSGENPAHGIDPARIGLVRDLAKAKRIAKVESVLPRTCRALGDDFRRLSDDFARGTPPTSFRSRADGLAFYRFLGRRRAAPALLDLAYCELAVSAIATRSSRDHSGSFRSVSSDIAIRRAPRVRLRICQFDVRAFFEDDGTAIPAAIPRSPIHLAILADPLAGTPRILQLTPGLFDFVRALRAPRVLPAVTDEDTRQLLDDLEQWGLVEIVRAGG
jgi:hypothetical protein